MRNIRRNAVDDIRSSENTISPITNRNVGLKIKTSSYIKKMLVFSLYSSILLWPLNTRMLYKSAKLIIKLRKQELTPSITLKNFNRLMKLSVNLLKELR